MRADLVGKQLLGGSAGAQGPAPAFKSKFICGSRRGPARSVGGRLQALSGFVHGIARQGGPQSGILWASPSPLPAERLAGAASPQVALRENVPQSLPALRSVVVFAVRFCTVLTRKKK